MVWQNLVSEYCSMVAHEYQTLFLHFAFILLSVWFFIPFFIALHYFSFIFSNIIISISLYKKNLIKHNLKKLFISGPWMAKGFHTRAAWKKITEFRQFFELALSFELFHDKCICYAVLIFCSDFLHCFEGSKNFPLKI